MTHEELSKAIENEKTIYAIDTYANMENNTIDMVGFYDLNNTYYFINESNELCERIVADSNKEFYVIAPIDEVFTDYDECFEFMINKLEEESDGKQID